ncbi:MAG: conserved hypothetical protein [Marine Group I thaumarchaeote]|nr:MAG: conserved hypothetical protein [Marine Group I thaumarchaeote]
MVFEQILERIMESDVNIRNCILADIEGKIITVKHREGVTNYLSEEETAASLKRAATAWKARKKLRPKIGKGLYAVAAFEKITRITFPLGPNNLLYVSIGSDQVRTDYHQGGQKEIIEHVLNILGNDPTLQ